MLEICRSPSHRSSRRIFFLGLLRVVGVEQGKFRARVSSMSEPLSIWRAINVMLGKDGKNPSIRFLTTPYHHECQPYVVSVKSTEVSLKTRPETDRGQPYCQPNRPAINRITSTRLRTSLSFALSHMSRDLNSLATANSDGNVPLRHPRA